MYYSKTLFAQKSYSFDPFIAPLDFDADNEEINIYEIFLWESNSAKKAIFSVGQTTTTTTFTAVGGRSFKIGQEVDGVMTYTTIASGTYTWTVGSVKRHVIVIDSASSITFIIPISAVWVYLGLDVNFVSSVLSNTTLKYIHRDRNNNALGLPNTTYLFDNATNLTGIIYVPESFTVIPGYCFRNCSKITDWVGQDVITSIQINGMSNMASFIGRLPSNLLTIGDASITNNKTITNNVTSLTSAISNAISFLGCTNITGTIQVPPGVTKAYRLIYQCTNVNRVNIPSSVTQLSQAFASATSLSRIDIYCTSPPSDGDPYFHNTIKSTCIVHVPAGCTANYRANTYWNAMVNIIDDL